jgi:predicted XRE-type DNA-binding protein
LISYLIKKSDLKQAEIADKIGYNKDYISRGIGRKLIDDSLINKILEVINVSKNDIL